MGRSKHSGGYWNDTLHPGGKEGYSHSSGNKDYYGRDAKDTGVPLKPKKKKPPKGAHFDSKGRTIADPTAVDKAVEDALK